MSYEVLLLKSFNLEIFTDKQVKKNEIKNTN